MDDLVVPTGDHLKGGAHLLVRTDDFDQSCRPKLPLIQAAAGLSCWRPVTQWGLPMPEVSAAAGLSPVCLEDNRPKGKFDLPTLERWGLVSTRNQFRQPSHQAMFWSSSFLLIP